MRDAFQQLSEELARRKVKAHIYNVGGAVMALGFDSRRLTHAVDALIREGHGPVTDAVLSVARHRGWSDSWLNEQAASAMPRGSDTRARTVFGDGNLVVTAASAEHLLAMKVRAGRIKDYDDIALLIDCLRLRSAKEVFDQHDEVFPGSPPPMDSFKNVCELLRKAWPEDRSLEGEDRYGYDSPADLRER
ncbi:MAG: hypothetical protein OXJ37_20315 [Bryobacterales bacterium]|nr:hypothetical protein [Bryobacterales bacterium]MDE0621991.1 hypothetical protein [Bryobacterales bacterium]